MLLLDAARRIKLKEKKLTSPNNTDPYMKNNTTTPDNKRAANLRPHPLGAIFPTMTDEEYKEFVSGMKKNGYDRSKPVILLDGMILDGNHRYTAARKLKLEFPTKEYTGDDPMAFVIQENLQRRHLNPSQAATVGAALVQKMKEIEKAERDAQKEAAKKNGSGKKVKAKKSKGSKAAKAAKAVNVSERQIAKAAALQKDNPEAFNQVREGEKTLHAASTEHEAAKSKEQMQSEAFAAAEKRINEVCGEGFALIAAKKLQAKDILRLSELDQAEQLRIKPLIEAGWSLKLALGYTSTSLTPAHPMRAFLDRTVAQNGSFSWNVEAYGKTFSVEFREQAKAA